MIQTEHQGFKITFSDNEEVWNCWELRMEHKSLGKLKQKINKWLKERLSKSNITCAFRDTYGHNPYEEATVVGCVNDAPGEFWITVGKDARRRKVKITELYPWTEELSAALAAYDAQRAAGNALLREATEGIKAFKVAGIEEFRATVRGARVLDDD